MASRSHYGVYNAPLTFEEDRVSEVEDKISDIQDGFDSRLGDTQ